MKCVNNNSVRTWERTYFHNPNYAINQHYFEPRKRWINAVEIDSESKKLENRTSRQAGFKASFKARPKLKQELSHQRQRKTRNYAIFSLIYKLSKLYNINIKY
jgi:hypothetical protein